jgi:endonuclease YncB( thermonuclease family)
MRRTSRPRRRYRRRGQQRARRTALVVGIAILGLFGWIAFKTWPGLFDTSTIASTAFADNQVVMTGRVVGITDGDTLTLLVDRTQHKIRLAQIDTPERGQPWAARASQALADKVFRGW